MGPGPIPTKYISMEGNGNFGFIIPCSTSSGAQAFLALSLKRCKHLVTGKELGILDFVLKMPEGKVNTAIFPLSFLLKLSDAVAWT